MRGDTIPRWLTLNLLTRSASGTANQATLTTVRVYFSNKATGVGRAAGKQQLAVTMATNKADCQS